MLFFFIKSLPFSHSARPRNGTRSLIKQLALILEDSKLPLPFCSKKGAVKK
jgi:hypothetical protein